MKRYETVPGIQDRSIRGYWTRGTGTHTMLPGKFGSTPYEEVPLVLTLNPYLGFDGNCEEAFELYRSIFGGELELNRYSEMPPGTPVDPDTADKIMHVSLPLADGQVLMGSDRAPGMGTTTFGDSVAISVSPSSAEDGQRIFDALAAGGTVVMPYERQFWGADYGMCRDRFGINWMVNFDPNAG